MYIILYNFIAYFCFLTSLLTAIFSVKFLMNCASLANPCETFAKPFETLSANLRTRTVFFFWPRIVPFFTVRNYRTGFIKSPIPASILFFLAHFNKALPLRSLSFYLQNRINHIFEYAHLTI